MIIIVTYRDLIEGLSLKLSNFIKFLSNIACLIATPTSPIFTSKWPTQETVVSQSGATVMLSLEVDFWWDLL
jgi:hypothetical protein